MPTLAKSVGALTIFLGGCTAPLQRTPTAPAMPPPVAYDCAGLDNQHRAWGAVAKFAGVLSGSGGLATLPISDDQKTLRFSVGISSAVLGALAVTAVYIEQDAAATWAKRCSSQ